MISHHFWHEAQAQIRADRWEPEVIRIQDSLLAAAPSHVEQGSERNASAESSSPVGRSHRHHVKVPDIQLRQQLIGRGRNTLVACGQQENPMVPHSRIA